VQWKYTYIENLTIHLASVGLAQAHLTYLSFKWGDTKN